MFLHLQIIKSVPGLQPVTAQLTSHLLGTGPTQQLAVITFLAQMFGSFNVRAMSVAKV